MPIITLPKSALIYMDKDYVEINIPNKELKKINMKNIKNAKGLLKHKKIDHLNIKGKSEPNGK